RQAAIQPPVAQHVARRGVGTPFGRSRDVEFGIRPDANTFATHADLHAVHRTVPFAGRRVEGPDVVTGQSLRAVRQWSVLRAHQAHELAARDAGNALEARAVFVGIREAAGRPVDEDVARRIHVQVVGL